MHQMHAFRVIRKNAADAKSEGKRMGVGFPGNARTDRKADAGSP
jgi:hypothetical protein